MNRTERLYAIAEELRFAGDSGRTSASLAEQFEVTTRTIKRDVSALQQAGLPIWGEGRPGGGYRMMASSATLPPVNFTAGEAAAVAVALSAEPGPFATEGAAALTKLLGVMTPEGRTAVNDLLARVWTRDGHARTPAARVLDEAVRLARVTVLTYVDGQGRSTRRRVEPLAFARTGQRWYLLAYCHLRRGGRWFRLDRIRDAALTAERAPARDLDVLFGEPPPDAHPLSVPAPSEGEASPGAR